MDVKKTEQYVKTVLKKMESAPDSLDRNELRLAKKYLQHQNQAQRIAQDIGQMKNQIVQAEARVRSLELQAESEAGKATSCLEILVSMKFEEDEDISKDPGKKPMVLKEKKQNMEKELS